MRRVVVVVCVVVVGGWVVGVGVSGAASTVRYVAVSGADEGNDCSVAARPCRSFDAAYRAAVAGDSVQVAGGSYPGQAIAHEVTRRYGRSPAIPPSRPKPLSL